MTTGERDEDAARREAERALGNDRKKTPPVSDRPAGEPVEVPRPDLEDAPRRARDAGGARRRGPR